MNSLARNFHIQPRRNGQKHDEVVVREHTLLTGDSFQTYMKEKDL